MIYILRTKSWIHRYRVKWREKFVRTEYRCHVSSIQKDNGVLLRGVTRAICRGMTKLWTVNITARPTVLFRSWPLTYFSSTFFLLSISICIIVRPPSLSTPRKVPREFLKRNTTGQGPKLRYARHPLDRESSNSNGLEILSKFHRTAADGHSRTLC